jgi:hypothetical protein
MRDNQIVLLTFAVILVLFALATAMGAVSIGTTSFISGGAHGQEIYLAHSTLFELISVALVLAGVASAYFAGRESVQPS